MDKQKQLPPRKATPQQQPLFLLLKNRDAEHGRIPMLNRAGPTLRQTPSTEHPNGRHGKRLGKIPTTNDSFPSSAACYFSIHSTGA